MGNIKPSIVAKFHAAKRAKARNLASGAGGNRAAINNLDLLKALDREHDRANRFEQELKTAVARIAWLERAFRQASTQ